MPELPEVETIVRGLDPLLRGRRIEAVWGSGLPLHLNRPVDLRAVRAVTVGHTIRRVRRARQIPAGRDRRDDDGCRRPSGHDGAAARPAGGGGARAAHARRVHAERRRRAAVRRRASLRLGRGRSPAGRGRGAGSAGPGPAERARRAGAGGRAGCLARAREIVPARSAARGGARATSTWPRRCSGRACTRRRRRGGSRGRAPALLDAIRASLEGGIARRGTTLRDYVDADGQRGDNAQALLVYGREGEPCPTCGASIRRRVDAGPRDVLLREVSAPLRRARSGALRSAVMASASAASGRSTVSSWMIARIASSAARASRAARGLAEQQLQLARAGPRTGAPPGWARDGPAPRGSPAAPAAVAAAGAGRSPAPRRRGSCRARTPRTAPARRRPSGSPAPPACAVSGSAAASATAP